MAYSVPILFWLKVVSSLKLSLSFGFTTLHYTSVCECALLKARVIGSGSLLAIPFAAWSAAVSSVQLRVLHKLEQHRWLRLKSAAG